MINARSVKKGCKRKKSTQTVCFNLYSVLLLNDMFLRYVVKCLSNSSLDIEESPNDIEVISPDGNTDDDVYVLEGGDEEDFHISELIVENNSLKEGLEVCSREESENYNLLNGLCTNFVDEFQSAIAELKSIASSKCSLCQYCDECSKTRSAYDDKSSELSLILNEIVSKSQTNEQVVGCGECHCFKDRMNFLDMKVIALQNLLDSKCLECFVAKERIQHLEKKVIVMENLVMGIQDADAATIIATATAAEGRHTSIDVCVADPPDADASIDVCVADPPDADASIDMCVADPPDADASTDVCVADPPDATTIATTTAAESRRTIVVSNQPVHRKSSLQRPSSTQKPKPRRFHRKSSLQRPSSTQKPKPQPVHRKRLLQRPSSTQIPNPQPINIHHVGLANVNRNCYSNALIQILYAYEVCEFFYFNTVLLFFILHFCCSLFDQ